MRKPEIERPGRNGVSAILALQAVARAIAKRNQRAHPTGIGKRQRLGGHLDPGRLQPGGERVQIRRVGHLPAEEARPLGQRAVDDDALLAVVHPEGQ